MKKGFSLIELVIVIGLLLIISAVSFVAIRSLLNSFQQISINTIEQTFNDAARNARYNYNNSDWRVYLTVDGTNNLESITLFSGTNYASRDTAYDQKINFDKQLIPVTIDLTDIYPYTGDGYEVIFEQTSGESHQIGTIELYINEETYNITINEIGVPTN